MPSWDIDACGATDPFTDRADDVDENGQPEEAACQHRFYAG